MALAPVSCDKQQDTTHKKKKPNIQRFKSQERQNHRLFVIDFPVPENLILTSKQMRAQCLTL